MTIPGRNVLLAALVLALAMLAACSNQSDSAQTAESPTPESAAPIATEVSVPHTTVQLWYPTGPGQLDSIERLGLFDSTDPEYVQLAAVLDAWIEGPTNEEVDRLGIQPFRSSQFDTCDHPFQVETSEEAAVVTLCQRFAPSESDVQLLEQFERTVGSMGLFERTALLNADGDRCIGTVDQAEPLSCVPPDFQAPADSWFRCPIGRATATAKVTGVEEWVNTRHAPSLAAPEVERLNAGALVIVFPSTLSYDGASHWWITVELGGKGRCASVAAEFLTDSFGNLADLVPGVSYQLPTTGIWEFQERESVFDQTSWVLRDSFATSVSIQVLDGRRIDERLARVDLDNSDFYYPDDWYQEPTVAGADRTAQILSVGDGGSYELLAEVGDFTVLASTYVYIEDRAPNDEMATFRQSITIDRAMFLNAMQPAGARSIELHGHDYVVVPQVASTYYSEAQACGTGFDYHVINELGRRRVALQIRSASPLELPDDHIIWELYCEGGTKVMFGVGHVDQQGLITVLGWVPGGQIGVRADFGALRIEDADTIVFEGETFGGAPFTDRFDLEDLLDSLQG